MANRGQNLAGALSAGFAMPGALLQKTIAISDYMQVYAGTVFDGSYGAIDPLHAACYTPIIRALRGG